jgi:RNA polymerase sigma-70 factor (ECF subfamily)
MYLVERPTLTARFRAGEREALDEVYRHYAPEVAELVARGFSFSSGPRQLRFRGYAQPFDLDNAVQETFVRAFHRRARLGYDGLRPYRPYLLTIARNVVIDELRRREVAMGPLIDERREHDGEPTSAPSPERECMDRELTGLYRRFLEGLDGRDRDYFRARFEDGETQVAAGVVCGLSHMRARVLEAKLRRRFRRFMNQRGYLDERPPPPGRRTSRAV